MQSPDKKRWTLGICIMPRKLDRPYAKEMVRILKSSLKGIVFSQECVNTLPISAWPKVDVLLTFYHKTLPYKRVLEYIYSNEVHCMNDMSMQEVLFDRRLVYIVLRALKVPTPAAVFFNKEESEICPRLRTRLEYMFNIKIDLPRSREVEMHETHIVVDGVCIEKPFVEKPADAEDHNVFVYYKDGSVRKLFRKANNLSSVLKHDIVAVRSDRSYCYEPFIISKNNQDIKAYAVGADYVLAQSRKAPTVDGIVDRDYLNQEKRAKVSLNEEERNFGRVITAGFKQFVCGFDILRTETESYVIDVNGWSFVKFHDSYYRECTRALINMVRAYRPPLPAKVSKFVMVLRHGDRTPKQKMKLKILVPNLMISEEKVLAPAAMIETFRNYFELCGNAERKESLLKMMGLIRGSPDANFKLQVKRRKDSTEFVLKWGGESTHVCKHQCSHLGRKMRLSLVENNPDLLSNPILVSSGEKRVLDSAMSFASGLMVSDPRILENQDLLDDTFHSADEMEVSKEDLSAAFDAFLKEDGNVAGMVQVLSGLRFEEERLRESTLSSTVSRWNGIQSRVAEDGTLKASIVGEIYDSLKYDMIHNTAEIGAIFGDSLAEFFERIKKYNQFVVHREYGVSKASKSVISRKISGGLLDEILGFLGGGGESGACFYFTKESRMYTLSHLLEDLCGAAETSIEFDYLSYIAISVFGDEAEIVFNSGIDFCKTEFDKEKPGHWVPLSDSVVRYRGCKDRMIRELGIKRE